MNTVIISLLLLAIYFILKGKFNMQAKFTITFTETLPVAPIQLTTSAFSGIVGQPETGSLAPTGGNGGPYTVTVDPTTPLPDGIVLDAQGNVSGSATAAGSSSVNVLVADSQG
ncbi:MAG: hypothetical protein JWQ87_5476 [Candidatus Sulfotelmatobacter sp.]|nr:hypothetical protein [Candidatus Sulfotelmatobacter sp.]